MTRLEWGNEAAAHYETGVDSGVIYPFSAPASSWGGLVTIAETPESEEPEELFFDGVKYLDLESTDAFKAVVTALSTPPALDAALGILPVVKGFFLTNQNLSRFNFSYRSLIGETGFKIHLVYNCIAKHNGRTYTTLKDDTTVEALSYEINTIPVEGSSVSSLFRPTAHFIVDSTKTSEVRMTALQDQLYGTDTSDPEFPTIFELVDIFKNV